MARLIALRNSRLASTRPSGNPRKIRSATPTFAAASVCSRRRMPAICDRGTEGSNPPASPSVTRQYVTWVPASDHVAAEPAAPKSTSSGWAMIIITRSTGVSSSMIRPYRVGFDEHLATDRNKALRQERPQTSGIAGRHGGKHPRRRLDQRPGFGDQLSAGPRAVTLWRNLDTHF